MDTFIRLDPVETAIAMPRGREPAVGAGCDRPPSVRVRLEALVRSALADQPCFVMFSGGRDSSAILALATDVARREGLPLPVPLIGRYSRERHPDAYEQPWQERVLEHTGITDYQVLDLDDDERILGEAACRALLRHGAVWPASVQSQEPFFTGIPAGSVVLTGEGGDQAFLPRRITPASLLLKHRRRPSRRLLREIAATAVPTRIRSRAQSPSPWLRGRAVGAQRRARLDMATEPWGWDRQTRRLYTRRAETVALANITASAAEHGVRMVHPFADRTFLEALATEGGTWGYAGRTDAMRAHFSDLLPDAVLSRRSKAWFSTARWGEAERDFARSWDGLGVSPWLVDVDALRDRWLDGSPQDQATYHLLQVAWLASQPTATAATPSSQETP